MTRTLGIITLAVGLSLSSTARAQEATADEDVSRLLVPSGMSLSLGGGVGGFVDDQMRDLTGTAGLWEARLMFGTRLPVGVELGYIGGLQTIDSLGLDTDARLLTTSFEANARVNILGGRAVQPYIFAGAGWRRFELTNVDVNQSSVEDQDDTVVVPVGLGFGGRYLGVLGDLRGTYRPTFYEDLVPSGRTGDEHENLDEWTVTARVGYEF